MNVSPLQLCFMASTLAHGAVLSGIYLSYSTQGPLSQSTIVGEELIEITVAADDLFIQSGPRLGSSRQTKSLPTLTAGPVTKQLASEPGDPKVQTTGTVPIIESIKAAEFEIPVLQSSAAEPAPAFNAAIAPVEQKSATRLGTHDFVSASYLRAPKPAYPKEARKRKEQGLVIVGVSLDAFGHPLRCRVIGSSGFLSLDTAAVKAVNQWVFQPALSGNTAVTSEVEVPIRFELKN